MKKTAVSLWGSPTVYQMLHNQTYIGDLVQGRHKKVGYKSKKTVWLPKSQWIVVENTHAPIIDRDTFETVQRMLAARTRSGGRGTIIGLPKKWFADAAAVIWSRLPISQERMELKDAMSAAGCTSVPRNGAAIRPAPI